MGIVNSIEKEKTLIIYKLKESKDTASSQRKREMVRVFGFDVVFQISR